MDISAYIDNVTRRLELAAEEIDDLANTDWIGSEHLRELLFGLEAHVWRVSRSTRKAPPRVESLAWLLYRLIEIRSALLECWRLRAWADDEALVVLDRLRRALEGTIDDIVTLAPSARVGGAA